MKEHLCPSVGGLRKKICETGFYKKKVEEDFKQCDWEGIIFFTQEKDA